MQILSSDSFKKEQAQKYLMRETLLYEKQKYFQSILQKLQFSNEDEDLKIIIDQSNQQLEIPSSLDCKFACHLPKNIDHTIKYIVINETIETNQLNVEELQTECQPQYNVLYEFLQDPQIERESLIHKYLIENIHEEQDVLIYCKNLDELEILRRKLEQLGKIILKVSSEFDELFNQLTNLNSKQQLHNHQIFLALEPQYFESENITLIIQTEHRETIKHFNQNSVIYENELLSRQELMIREIPKCASRAIKVIYNFSEETLLKMSGRHQINETHQVNNEQQDLTKTTAIIKGVLNTTGTLQHFNQESGLAIRTNQLWSNRGDPYSWLEIIEQFGNQINSIFFNLDIDKNQSVFDYLTLEQWCSKNMINFVKSLEVLLYIQNFSKKYDCPSVNILCQHGLMMPPVRRSSSFQTSLEEKPQVEEQLINSFTFAELKEDRLYHFKDQNFALNDKSVYKYKGRLQQSILILAIKDEKILYLHNKMRKQSLVQKEFVINNVSNAILEQLWKDQGEVITQFENSFNCTIEPNPDLNLITLYYEDKIDINQFQANLDYIKSGFQKKNIEIMHISGKKLILQNGAEIFDYLLEHESKEFILKGLPLNVTEQDIHELFENFITITSIQFQHFQDQVYAKITIEDKTDIPYVIEYYDQSFYKDNYLTVQIEQGLNKIQENLNQKFILNLVWYAKLCAGDCTVVFQNEAKAQECLVQFDHQLLEGKEIKIQKIDEVTLKFMNLHPLVTEREIYMISGGKKNIKKLEFNSKSVQESKEDYSQKILSLIQSNIEKQQKNQINFNQQVKIIKKQGGKRKVGINVHGIGLIQQLIETLNGSRIQLGSNIIKIYCKGKYYQYHKINKKMKQIVQNELQKYNLLQFKFSFDQTLQKDLLMTVVSSNVLVHQQLDKMITTFIQGNKVDLKQNADIYFRPFLITKLQEYDNQLEDAFIIIEKNRQELRVCCSQERFQEISDHINQFNQSVVKHSIKIPNDSLKYLVKAQGFEGLKKQFNLASVKYKKQTKELQLEGDGRNLQDALAYLQSLVFSSAEENQQQTTVDETIQACPICFEKMTSAYQLQGCGHKCCLECMIMQCQGVLQDMKLFPIRCPICNEKMILYDIFQLIGNDQKQQVIDMALNKFILENSKRLTFCYTPGCLNFEEIEEDNTISCNLCQKNYCILCKALKHPGLTCEENRIGDLALLLKLMKEQDIRKCPNCSALIQRIDGCYRVTCSACQKSICWKNGKDGLPCMKCFDTAGECYDHLSKQHGGYW